MPMKFRDLIKLLNEDGWYSHALAIDSVATLQSLAW